MGVWLLSKMPVDEMPWLIIDFKREPTLARIPYLQLLDLQQELPTNPGVYIVQPFPSQDAEMTDLLERVWEQENIGLYIDEGVMLAKNSALDNILIQGRSKQIPVIMLTQRPVGISRFAFSESQFFIVFPNHDKRERKTISEFTPIFGNASLDNILLPRYHAYYYDVIQNKVARLQPVSIEEALKTLERKLQPKQAPLLETPQPAPSKRFIAL